VPSGSPSTMLGQVCVVLDGSQASGLIPPTQTTAELPGSSGPVSGAGLPK
jgi:hypothetical protein